SAPFAGSRTRRGGRRTTPGRALMLAISRFALGRRILGRGRPAASAHERNMKDFAAQVYLLDVEGTVAPISFVYEQLFPYARAHFEAFLRETFASVVATKDMSLLADEQRGVMFDLLKLMRESRL